MLFVISIITTIVVKLLQIFSGCFSSFGLFKSVTVCIFEKYVFNVIKVACHQRFISVGPGVTVVERSK